MCASIAKRVLIPVTAILYVFLFVSGADASVSAVSLTVPSPTTMSNGRGYYLAGVAATPHTYVFTVSAVNAGATSWADYASVSISILTDATAITVTTTDGSSCTTTGGADATVSRSGSWSNPAFTFTVRFRWAASASVSASRAMTATVTDSGGVSRTDTETLTYGICSGISVANFAQSGAASDGYISTTHAAFNVSGTVVYDIPGYSLETASDRVDDVDLTSSTLVLQTTGYSTPVTISSSAFTQAIPANALAAYIGSRTWRITASGNTSSSGLSLRINTVHILPTGGITFSGGIGRGPDKTGVDNLTRYYRKYGSSGPKITLNAETFVDDGSGTAMHGDTVFTVQLTNGTLIGTFNVTVPSGQKTATASLPYDSSVVAAFAVASGATEQWTYQVISITSAAGYELAQTDDGNGTPYTASIYWDREDPPTSLTSYVTISSVLPSSTSVAVYWTPLGYAVPDEDFYEYKIHFREAGGQWRIWDSANDSTMAWPVSSLNTNLLGGSKYTTIPNLKIFTTYEYYVTAVDIFGNESNGGIVPVTPATFKTLPYSIDVILSDGITTYQDSSFADLTPSVRPLRETNIKVTMRIVSSTDLPEVVKVWFAVGDTSTSPDIVNTSGATNTVNSGAFAAGALESSVANKTSTNEWTAYLSTQTSIIKAGNNVRFVVESIKNGVSSFSDHVLDSPTPNPNLSEWTFCVTSGTTFTPWPVRVLNNVITNAHPKAYPSYYLTDPAYVTITIYDVRGQQIVTLLDNAYRLGGQNIKENGWNGRNKAGRECGPGLYFVRFKAKRVSDGKVIIDEMKKLVIAR